MTTGTRFALWAAIAGTLAVFVAGLAAIVVVERTLIGVVDDRLEVAAAALDRRSAADACRSIGSTTAAEGRQRVVAVVDSSGRELCRSSPVAPAARALATDEAATVRTVQVDGRRWRRALADTGDGGRVVAGELVESALAARDDARRAIVAAMVLGMLVAAAGGALAAIPARRRLARLLDRVAAAGGDASGTTRVGRIGGRDLDAAAASFDRLLADVRRADAAQRRLLSDAAHQLRTPVTSIRTNAQLLERDPSLTDEARDMAGRIARQSRVVADLVAGLVDLVAATAWNRRSDVEVPLAPLVADAVGIARSRWPDVEIAVEADDSRAAVDAELAQRAFVNLLDNAILHGGPPILVRVAGGVVTVVDGGSGFDDPEASFEPFVSGDGGSGLGLAFVRHVARAHGGDAWIELAPRGIVHVRLAPRSSDDSQVALGEPSGASSRTGSDDTPRGGTT